MQIINSDATKPHKRSLFTPGHFMSVLGESKKTFVSVSYTYMRGMRHSNLITVKLLGLLTAAFKGNKVLNNHVINPIVLTQAQLIFTIPVFANQT